MKKKMYFIISSILQILGSLYMIINANNIIQFQIETIAETYAMFPIDFQERMLSMMQNNGATFLSFMSIIGIILNAIILKISIGNEILPKKGRLIAFSAICFFTTNSGIVSWLSIINLVVLLCSKRKNPEDYPNKEKKEIPHLEYRQSTKKELIYGIILILVYFSQFLLGFVIPENASFNFKMAIQVVFYIIVFALAIIIFKDKLKSSFKLFKENSKAYFQFILPKIGITYIIFLISNILCILITQKSVSENQAALEIMPQWFMILAAIIWAPIVEELIFRGVFRRFIKNDKIFIVVSAVIFGLLHSLSEVSLFSVIVTAVPYAILGGLFAYLYAKTDNICTNIFAHGLQNTVAIVLSLFLV